MITLGAQLVAPFVRPLEKRRAWPQRENEYKPDNYLPTPKTTIIIVSTLPLAIGYIYIYIYFMAC